MGLLINNSLIWISIPRCASTSIENALLSTNLKIKKTKSFEETPYRHFHIPLDKLYSEFGYNKTICVKRNWFEHFISGLQHLYREIENSEIYTVKKKWVDIDNSYLYDIFDDEFVNALYANRYEDIEVWNAPFLKLINETEIKNLTQNDQSGNPVVWLSVLLSQNFWTLNQKCTYEFDINNLDLFEDFIYDTYNEKIKIPKINQTNKVLTNKIIVDDKLKQWVWDKFEKRFEKRQNLL